jgi:quinol-cytochrome oxidoreductase complex cytochrome b subunit
VARQPGDRAPPHRQGDDFPTPKNLNYWWTFGGILAIMLVMQIITGIVLAMHYTPHVAMAFDSVEHIMRDVNWRLAHPLHARQRRLDVLHRRLHPHVPRLYYGSYKAPREILWILGV